MSLPSTVDRWSAATAWGELQDALATHEPPCQGDDRFIRDGRNDRLTDDLAKVCRACPVLAECRSYATKARPHAMAGYWGMKWRGKHVEDD